MTLGDRVFRVLQRCQVLPPLPLWAWLTIWSIVALVALCNFIGGRVFNLFDFNDTIGTATIFFFFLLMLTPLYHPPRTMYFVRPIDGDDWLQVSVEDALRYRNSDAFVVRRVVMFRGQIMEQDDL